MSKLRKGLKVFGLPVVCLSLLLGGSNAYAATKAAVTKLSATSDSTDYEDVAGIWKYKDSDIYISLEANQSWAVYNVYGMTVDSGTYEISGDVLTLHFDSDGGTDNYTISEKEELVDVEGKQLIRVDKMEFLPRPDDRLTQVTKFPDTFDNVDIYYPEGMIVTPRTDIAHALDFFPEKGKGTVDTYSTIIVMFQKLKENYDTHLQYGSAISKKGMGYMLDNFIDFYYGDVLVKSIGSDFKDCGSYYSIKGYMWLDGKVYNEDIGFPVRGVVELRYFGPTGYALASITIAKENRVENYAAIAEKMLDSCTYKNDWTTSPKPLPKQPGKAKSSKKSSTKSSKKSSKKSSGGNSGGYYWTDDEGDVWYWNGSSNEFVSYSYDGYVDSDGSFYESNDYYEDNSSTIYYDDYDPYTEWASGSDDYYGSFDNSDDYYYGDYDW